MAGRAYNSTHENGPKGRRAEGAVRFWWGWKAMRSFQGSFQVTDMLVLIVRDSPIVKAPDSLVVGDRISGYTLST